MTSPINNNTSNIPPSLPPVSAPAATDSTQSSSANSSSAPATASKNDVSIGAQAAGVGPTTTSITEEILEEQQKALQKQMQTSEILPSREKKHLII